MKLILDRIDVSQRGVKIATFESDYGMITISEKNMPEGFINELFINAIVEAELVDGKLSDPIIMTDESEKKERIMRSRLNGLFKKGKK